jgi:serine phosphatase RsbU (regulator of sigma subunit)
MEVWGGNSSVNRGLQTPGLQVWVYSQPYEDATNGGDVYYVSSCASGRITRLLLADVCGHGEAVASISTGLRDLMRRNVNLINQSRFVSEMNQQFANSTETDEFATAVVCTFFSPTRSLQFCNAGHPIPFLYRAKRSEWVLASDVASVTSADDAANTPLGVLDEADYSKFEISLEPEDMVLCVSDAFTESVDKSGRMLGSNGLLNVVRQLDASRPKSIIGELTTVLAAMGEQNLDADDATILLFRADGTGPSFASDLMAPIRMLRGVRDTGDRENVTPRDLL